MTQAPFTETTPHNINNLNMFCESVRRSDLVLRRNID